MSSLSEQQVLGVRHWTDTLFSFKTTREASFRYQSGQFVMIGLEVDGRPLLRAYSLASAHYEEELEFFSIKVPDGPLTSRLQHIAPGDRILVGRKATGTLLLDNLLPGRNLYLDRHRHRACAVPEPHQGPRHLRAVRERGPGPRGAPCRRARLWRGDREPAVP